MENFVRIVPPTTHYLLLESRNTEYLPTQALSHPRLSFLCVSHGCYLGGEEFLAQQGVRSWSSPGASVGQQGPVIRAQILGKL